MLAVYFSSFALLVLSQLFEWHRRRSETPSRALYWVSTFSYSTSLLVMVFAAATIVIGS